MNKRIIVIACTIFTIMLTSTLTACSVGHESANEVNFTSSDADNQVKPPAFQPANIVQMIELKQYDAVSKLFSDWELEQMPIDPSEVDTLQAAAYHADLEQMSGELSVIELSAPRSAHWRYVFFQHGTDGWKVVDYLDVNGRHAHEPTFRIEEFNNGESIWFVLNRLDGYGSGITLHRELWYKIGANGLEQQLDYVTRSKEWMSPSQTVYSDVNAHVNVMKDVFVQKEKEARLAIKINYEITLTDSDLTGYDSEEAAKLFDANRTLQYVWNTEKNQFELDPSLSDGDEHLLQFSPENLKRHFQPELEALAENASQPQLKWLEKIK